MSNEVQVLGPIHTQWVEALESGKYIQFPQGGCMCLVFGSHKEYCCLGVAAEMFSLKSDGISITDEDWNKLGLYNGTGKMKNSIMRDGKEFTSLTDMNDGFHIYDEGLNITKFTFAEIAAEIRKNPANFFSHSV